MKLLQQDLHRWLLRHVVAPAAVALAACVLALAVVVRVSSQLPENEGALATTVIAVLVVILLVALILLVTSWQKTSRYALSLSSDVASAGYWVMKTAFGKLPDNDPIIQQFPWVRSGKMPPANLPSVRYVSEWMDKWKADVLAQSARMNEEISRDMVLATEFQQAMLNRPYPEVPAVHVEGRLRLEFHHRYMPAMAVGGDFFDIIPIGNDCAGILIADVMGHGMRSALITAILRALLSELQPQARNAAHFLKEVNREFSEILLALPTSLFASAFYLVADTTSRIATYACAGHPPPFQIHRDRARVTRLSNPLPKGAALGLIEQETYRGETVRLLDGHGFIFFTDGVYECANPEGEEYGLARMEKVIQANIYKSTPEILDALIQSINNFVRSEPLADDLCLVAVDVTTKPKPA